MREAGTRPSAITALLGVFILAGCQTGAVEVTRSGAEPVVIQLGTPEGDASPYAPTVERFAAGVAEASGGSVRIEVVWEADPDGWSPRTERRLVEMVAQGELEAALIPTRVFDTAGVRTLRALQAPFLVDDHALLAEVTRGEIAERLLAGLSEADVVGLALWPEELRHPVSYEAPLLGLSDFDGVAIRVPTSETSFAVLRALGANPVDPDEHGSAVHRGEVTASESAFGWGPVLPQLGTFTANLTLYPKVNAVVVAPATFQALSEDQRQQLRRAADDAHQQAVDELPDEHRSAAMYCASGGGVALTTEDALEEFGEAVAPVYAELEADPETSGLIAEIRAVDASLATAAPGPIATREIEAQVVDTPPVDVGDPEAPLPEGVLRTDLTEEMLRQMGVPEHAISDNRGVYTMTLRDGEWFQEGEEEEPGTFDHGGRYTVHGDVLSVSLTEPAHDAFCCEHYRWSVDGDQVIFEALVIEPLDTIWEQTGGALLADVPWTRIRE